MAGIFQVGNKYQFVGVKPHPRGSWGATRETKFTCVSAGERYAVLYWDGRVCGKKETTLVAENGTQNWFLIE